MLQLIKYLCAINTESKQCNTYWHSKLRHCGSFYSCVTFSSYLVRKTDFFRRRTSFEFMCRRSFLNLSDSDEYQASWWTKTEPSQEKCKKWHVFMADSWNQKNNSICNWQNFKLGIQPKCNNVHSHLWPENTQHERLFIAKMMHHSLPAISVQPEKKTIFNISRIASASRLVTNRLHCALVSHAGQLRKNTGVRLAICKREIWAFLWENRCRDST